MKLSSLISKHYLEVHTGGNWTASDLKKAMNGLTWEQATREIYSLNSIAKLVYHINYYTSEVIKVLRGSPLTASDALSFSMPPVTNEAEWQALKDKTIADAELFAALITEIPDEKLSENFTDEKYGTYYRNLHGITEHTHYHLGQIVILKKIVTSLSQQL